MLRRGYKFTNKRHSVSGIMSSVFGALSFITFALCIFFSYSDTGAYAQRLGVSAFFALVFMITGFVLGIKAATENDSFMLFRVLGIAVNVLALLALSAILYAGAYVD